MRWFPIMLAALAALTPGIAAAEVPHRPRDGEAVARGVRAGDLLPLHVIRDRVRIPGARFIGADLNGTRYRLRFMRGSQVIWVDVDGRSGQVLGYTGN